MAVAEGDFDYILVGGGAAGCVLARRLTENPANRVLLLEAGSAGQSRWVDIPAGFAKLLADSRHNWKLQSIPEENTLERVIAIPKGKGVGGSTLTNGMIYVRGQPDDFNTWAQLGATGWSWPEVEPFFRKVEGFDGEGEGRGRDGLLSITTVTERPAIAEAFIEAGVAAGHKRPVDYNGPEQDGFGYYQVNQRGGRRVSAAKAYLQPVLDRPNLAVVTSAHAKRILIEEGRAAGVVALVEGGETTFRARGEVIITAGAAHSPQLLELSGIGDPRVLGEFGIDTLHALPGVGANYMDHYCTRMSWRVKQPVTLNEQTRGLGLAKSVLAYALTRKGILTYGTGLAYGFMRTREGLAGPDVQLFFMHASYANAAERILDNEPGMTVGVTQLRPSSRGSIHIASADPRVKPAIRPNFLGTEEDRTCMVEGMKLTRQVMEQGPLDSYRAFELAPGEDCRSDEDWLHFARENGQTIYHVCGTCRMGRGPEAVVDPELRVHGLRGLRVVDASVMPSIVSGNTQAAVYVIAEKAADLIARDRRTH